MNIYMIINYDISISKHYLEKFKIKVLHLDFFTSTKYMNELAHFLSCFSELDKAKHLKQEILAIDMVKGGHVLNDEYGVFTIGVKDNIIGTIQEEPLIPVPEFLKVLDIYIAELEKKERLGDKYTLDEPITGEFEISDELG
jgi:hypothetical protein